MPACYTGIVLFLLFLFRSSGPLQESSGPCGIEISARVQELKGVVYLKRKNSSSPERIKKAQTHLILRRGDSIMCGRDGRVIIELCRNRVEVAAQNQYSVSAIDLISPEANKRININDFFKRFSRERDREFILFPSDDNTSVIRPETLIIRWRQAKNPLLNFSISRVTDDPFSILDDQEKIWEQEDIDGSLGELSSDKLRELLNAARRESPKQVYALVIQSGQEISTAKFKVLTSSEEELLLKELSQYDSDPSIVRHIGRACVYAKQGLRIDAALEYEAVLAEAPESIEVLQAVIAVQRWAGNLKRERELISRLP